MDEDILKHDADEQMVDDAFNHLLDDYRKSRHRQKVEVITKAFNFARQAHKGVRRLSGEPYIMHPIAVAQITCSEIGLGSTSISAALLHDVVEDTDYTVEDIENMFGPKIAQIVDGLTKISGGIFGDQASAQAENFRKLLLTMSEDIRVILIKIADRLHNMRTLGSQPANKQYKIAGETLYLYAPIAHRLGLYKIKSELENLSFSFEHPEEYNHLVQKLEKTQKDRHELFALFTKPIIQRLDEMGIKYVIKERVKTPYSIWTKMQNKNVTFDEIYDILAVRIIFTPTSYEKENAECFNIYVELNKIYESHPERSRDWITHPKANGYKALHLTLMSKQGHWVEVQIRSDRMDEIAEQGLAAHWKYKEGDDTVFTEDENELREWLRTIKEILDDPQPDAMDFLDSIKMNLCSNKIFIFTPRGEIRSMPVNSTALDFAFSIHTFLGVHCIGAKVNHKLVPLSYKLKSGDQVEILTSQSQHVDPSWINFVSSAKALSKIQAVIRRDARKMQKKGEDILKEFLQKKNFKASDDIIQKLTVFHNSDSREKFLQALGEKKIILGQKDVDELNGKNNDTEKSRWRKLLPFGAHKKKEKETTQELFIVPEGFNRKKPLFIDEDNISQFIFPDCCHCIPGDDVLGFITNKNQIEIHLRSCEKANKLKASFGNRIIDAKWNMKKIRFFEATIRMCGIDRRGLVNEVTRVLSNQLSVDIRMIMFKTENGIFEGTIQLLVHDREDLEKIMESLKEVNDLKEISRIM